MPKILHAMADAWLTGWDAGRAGKPESTCPFHPVSPDEESLFTNLWTSGWAAGLRNQPEDRQIKNRYLAISMGLTPSDLDPGELPPAA